MTVDLLRAKGPSASGTAEILTLAGAPRGSFYFHFPGGKEALVAEAVGRHGVATRVDLMRALEDRSSPLGERIAAWISGIADETARDDFRLGCAVASTALEVPVTSPLRDAAEEALRMWTGTLVEHLVQEGVDAERAAEVADAVIAGLEGATMMARARRDATPLRHVATTLGRLVAATVDASR